MISACTPGAIAVAMVMVSPLANEEILPRDIRQECATLHNDEIFFLVPAPGDVNCQAPLLQQLTDFYGDPHAELPGIGS